MAVDTTKIDKAREINALAAEFAATAMMDIGEKLYHMGMDSDDADVVRKIYDSFKQTAQTAEPKTPQLTLAPMNLIIDLSDNAVQVAPQRSAKLITTDIEDATMKLEQRIVDMTAEQAATIVDVETPPVEKPRRGRKKKTVSLTDVADE
jgi:hypothetical protein